MANETKHEKAPEGGPLKGGRPIDPERRDAAPHPTAEAERRAREVQSGKAAGETSEKKGGNDH